MDRRKALEIARHARLSKNTEKHIRKHFGEFGFAHAREFTRQPMLAIAASVVKGKGVRVFLETAKARDTLIVLHLERLLIVTLDRPTIRTMFKLTDEEYITRKIQRKHWIEIS